MTTINQIYKSNSGPITGLKYNIGSGSIFAFTENGKIVRIKTIQDALNRGNVNFFAKLLDGDGDFSETVHNSVYYDLYKSITLLNSENKIYEFIKSDVQAFSAFKYTKVNAVYVSDILKADEDFGFWKTITWKQTSLTSRVVVALKVSNSMEELLKLDWQYYISEESPSVYSVPFFVVTKDLDRFNLKGRFMMFKVELETSVESDNPVVGEFVISYAAKHSVFFFTRKIKIEKTSNIDNIILTASYSEPDKTEVKFGIVNSNTSDWEEYQIVNLDELVNLPSDYGNSVKIGIKMSSYSHTLYPVVQEFAFLIGSETDNLLNSDT